MRDVVVGAKQVQIEFRLEVGLEMLSPVLRDLVLHYINTEHAAAIRRLSFCLEEYLRYTGA